MEAPFPINDLRRWLARRLGREMLSDDELFQDTGMDSVAALEACRWIAERTGVTLEPSVFLEFPTLSALMGRIARRLPDRIPREDACPIAVIGFSGRFPGADTPEALWRNLLRGECAVTPIPENRRRYWDPRGLAGRAGSTFRLGAFLEDVERFDPLFFGISPKEAAVMDPQQRLFLEEAWKAIEDAGYAAESLSGTRCGVYAGVMVNDYHDLLTHADAADPTVHEMMNTASFLPGRVAYHLNLRGPALALDTASSSSLVAIDMACRALRHGEIDAALAGGATLYLSQKRYTLMEKAGMLTPTGVCRPFDAAADGMLPGEAVGVVMLKRLSDALADGDAIAGVILASGCNQAGRTQGITAPGVESQAELIATLYREAGIDPGSIGYVEAHGTGTRLGDPAEAAALLRVFSGSGGSGGPAGRCRIGSLKANLGHSFAAAGVTALIKALLMLRHRRLPPQIHFSTLHREIPLEGSPFSINTRAEPWEKNGAAPRRVAVSGVGFSGTNAHLVVAETPARPEPEPEPGGKSEHWFTLSAPDEGGLRRRAEDLLQWLRQGEAYRLADLSFTLNTGRTPFAERLAWQAADRAGVEAALSAFLSGEAGPFHRGKAGAGGAPAPDASPGERWVAGEVVDWPSADDEGRPRRLRLPVYRFGGEAYWYDRFPAAAASAAPIPVPPPATAAPSRGATRPPLRLRSLRPEASASQAQPIPAPEPVAVNAPAADPALLRQLIAQTLYLAPEQIGEDRKWSELGFDSILAVELARSIQGRFGIPFTAATLYDHPTVADLAAFLASRSPSASPALVPAAAPPLPSAPTPEPPPASALLRRVGELTAATLYVDAATLAPERRFAELGLDSILAVELARAISREWNLSFPAALLYEHPTPEAVTRYLEGHLAGPATPPAPVPVFEAAAPKPAPRPSAPPMAAVPARPAPAAAPAPALHEPIAIIGYAGRFPGAPDAEAFWELLAGGGRAIGPVPPERWKGGERGGFLSGIDAFDAAAFQIARAEAEQMDPQHRLFLEIAWQTIEHAGYAPRSPRSLSGGACGAFVGIGASDYFPQLPTPEAHSLLGNIGSGLTARLAYLLDWSGPSLAVDTACASSLTALYLACRSLQRRECDAALAGGVHLATSPRLFEAAARMGLLSPTGTCRTFDAAADGFVLGEGVGAVLLKRLSDAERDGDTVHGVIRGIAMSQDGARNGLTAPKAAGQAALQQRLYRETGVDPASIGYVELHGMSSRLSDEIEWNALRESFAGAPEGGCAVGSLKANIGHPLAASGMAGLLKLLLILRHGTIPPVAGLETPNPALRLAEGPFTLPTSLRPWTRSGDQPRRVALNGLSATGTNCHLVLEEAMVSHAPETGGEAAGPVLLPLSARDAGALRGAAAALRRRMEDGGGNLAEIAFTLQTGRDLHPERLALVAGSREEACAALARFEETGVADETIGIYRDHARGAENPAALLVSGEEGRAFLESAARNRALGKLARLWVSGVGMDWRLLYSGQTPRRIPLPGTVFERESYWLPEGPRRTVPEPVAAPVPNPAPATALTPAPAARPPLPEMENEGDREALLHRLIAEALRCAPAELEPGSDLFEHGFGSLYALQVAQRYEALTGIALPPKVFYEGRTLRDLCARVRERTPPRDRPATEGEKALWSLARQPREGGGYLLPVALRHARGDLPGLKLALAALMREQPALRSAFLWRGDALRVAPLAPEAIPWHGEEAAGDFATLPARMQAAARVPFDLDCETDPLWRAHWFAVDEKKGVLLLVFHHLIFDGYSLGSLLETLKTRLEAWRMGRPLPMPEPVRPMHAAETNPQTPRYAREREAWLARFPEGFAPLGLSRDGAAQPGDFVGALWQGGIPGSLVIRLRRLAEGEGVTLPALTLAVFELLLAARQPSGRLTLGVPVDLRTPEMLAPAPEPLGYFVNLLPVEALWKGGEPFREWMRGQFERFLEALEDRAFPFSHLANALMQRGKPASLDAAFYCLTWPNAIRRTLSERLEPGLHQCGEFPLVFELIEGAGDWRLNVKYRPAVFRPATVERLAADYLALLERVADDPDALSLPHPEPALAFPEERCVHRLIEEQVDRTPEATAVVFAGERLCYGELDARVNRLARYLAGRGVKPGMLVGVMLPRSPEMLIALLAIWKAGAAYVPLDPAYPPERIAVIVEDARLSALITTGAVGYLPERELSVIDPAREAGAIAAESAERPAHPCGDPAQSLAYVIFTSGSTGRPKGVQIAHRSLAHFLWCMAERPGCGPGDHLLALTTVSFDIAALELFLPLVTGASLEILSEETARNGLRLRRAIEAAPVTLLQATPATWKMLLAADLPPSPRIRALCGGEAWDGELARALLPRVGELWNMYGPTETTIWSSIMKIEPDGPVRLGEPIGNTRFYVLDENLRPVPRGEIGELYIGGDGLAKGYLHRPDLTDERFIPHPEHPHETIYRTGDLVRYV